MMQGSTYDDSLTQQDPWYVPPSYPSTAPPTDASPAPTAPDAGAAGATGTAPAPQPYTPPTYSTGGGDGMGGYMLDPTQNPAGGPAQTPAAGGGTTPPISAGNPAPGVNYDDILSRIRTSTDPQAVASARDELARSLQSELEADGHKISWAPNGQMMVDGRAYDLGTGLQPGGSSSFNERTGQYNTPMSPNKSAGTPGNPVNFDRTGFRDAWMGDPQDHQNANDLAAFLAANPQYASGVHLLPGKGDKAVLVGKDGIWGTADDEPMDLVIAQGEGGKGPGWTGAGGSPGGPGAGAGSYAAGKSGYLSFDPASGGWADPSMFGFDSLDPNAGGLPGYDQVYSTIAASDPNEAATANMVGNVLAHPETLDDTTLETMKSRDAEEMAAAQQAQDEELQHYGAGTGLTDSPWLSSQRADASWKRRSDTIANNRNLDVMAATTRGADLRSAAALGQSYGAYRTSKAQNAISTAVESVLGKLGEQRSRVQVNNAFKQAAASLGLSKEQLSLEYIKINNDYNIDLKKLAEQGSEFQQELAERIAQRKQQDDQYASDLNLRSQEFQHTKDQDYWQRARDTYAPRR